MDENTKPPSNGGTQRFTLALIGRSLVLAAIVALSRITPLYSAELQVKDLADFSLEQLSEVEVTSVAGHAESLLQAASSIFVISADDIHRSGVTTIPEALRLAPNLQVARVNASTYAITARGFNNALGNKLLVLIDGRTVYTPLFSGVQWDAQDIMLEDIDRIEVISGPGATLWGANAVNGVINIITASARDTQGGLATVGGGNTEGSGGLRYGGQFGVDGYYRVYGKRTNEFNTVTSTGAAVRDRFDRSQAGFRSDWGGADSNFTVQGDAYNGEAQANLVGKPTVAGMNLLGRWNRELENASNFSLQTYYDHTERDDPFTYGDRIDTFDIQLKYAFSPATAHQILWGAGYRYAQDRTHTNFNRFNPLPQLYIPSERNLHWGNVFLQDEITLHPKVQLTLGTKLESNVYTGVEVLPSVRLEYHPVENHFIWGAISHAVRAPARIDRDFHLDLQLPGLPLLSVINGGPGFQSEVANVFELGYRAQPFTTLSFSITGFHNEYDKLRSGQRPPAALIQNMMEGTSNGVETWGAYQALSNWRLSAGLVELRQNIGLKRGSLDPVGPSALGNDPEHQWQLRSEYDITEQHRLDMMVRHVGALPNPVVPAYTAVDVSWGWRINKNVELSLSGQNLFDPRHVEFGAPAIASEIERSIFLKLSLRTDPLSASKSR